MTTAERQRLAELEELDEAGAALSAEEYGELRELLTKENDEFVNTHPGCLA